MRTSGETITMSRATITAWREDRDTVDRLLADVRPLVPFALFFDLDAAINALVASVQLSAVAHALQGLGAAWEYLPGIFEIDADLDPATEREGTAS